MPDGWQFCSSSLLTLALRGGSQELGQAGSTQAGVPALLAHFRLTGASHGSLPSSGSVSPSGKWAGWNLSTRTVFDSPKRE